MGSRLELQNLLETILGSRNVYFNPPASVRMQYDAIRYSRKAIDQTYANNTVYKIDNCYEVIAIYRDPDSDLPMRLASIPMCRHDRQYVADNLIHDVYTLYY